MSFNCGSTISDACTGVTFDLSVNGTGYTAVNGRWFTLTNEIINIVTGLQNLFLIMASESLTVNMQKGMNGIRCASINGLINIW